MDAWCYSWQHVVTEMDKTNVLDFVFRKYSTFFLIVFGDWEYLKFLVLYRFTIYTLLKINISRLNTCFIFLWSMCHYFLHWCSQDFVLGAPHSKIKNVTRNIQNKRKMEFEWQVKLSTYHQVQLDETIFIARKRKCRPTVH